jgi:flavin-dependent dehydrogenase
MKKKITQVVIIGAGPSGSVAAALLHQHNIKVIVIEKSLFPRFSIGESLLPACMEVLEQANMLDAVKKSDFQFKNGAAFHYNGRYSEFDFNDKFTPGMGTTYQVQRANFDKVLADQAEEQGVDIFYQHELIDLNLEKKPLLTVLDENKQPYHIAADFVLDASGFGRVLPKLLKLEVPSTLPARKAIFTHIQDNISSTAFDRNKILISVHPDDAEVWYWLIPFSNGSCSLGVVAKADFLEKYPQDNIQALKQLVNEEENLKEVLDNALYPNPGSDIIGYSANVKQLCSDKFALLGNAGEFLDPVFSSGVTIAMKSAQFASETLVKQFSGEKVDWQKDYQERLMVGVNAFRCYVEGWYTGELQSVIFHPDPNPKIKQMICAILAGYAWDINNPFVTQPYRRLKAVAELCKQ